MDNYNTQAKCDVCGNTLLVGKTGNGECMHCGWYNNILGATEGDSALIWDNSNN